MVGPAGRARASVRAVGQDLCVALRDPEYRTIQDELRDTFGGCTVQHVREYDGTAYLLMTSPSGERRVIGFDAASVHDASSVWPALP